MKVTPYKCDLKDLGIGVSTGHRSPGLHMSEIYGKLFQKLEPKRFKAGSEPDPLRMELGLCFENILEEELKRRIQNTGERPGEFVTEEGIIFSPDLILFNGTTRLGEIKLTWMSSREVPRTTNIDCFPPKFDKYFVQMKAYAYHLNMPETRLFTFFVCGDWDRKTGNQPEFMAWDIVFTERELLENWKMLLNFAHKEGMLK